jgi:hypothetical protein
MLVIVRHCDSCPAFHDGKEVCLFTGNEAGQTRGIPMKCPLRKESVTVQLAHARLPGDGHSAPDDKLVSSVLHKELRNALDLPDDTDWPECMLRVYRFMGGRDDTDTDTDTVTVPCQNGPNAPAEATCDGCPLLIEGGDCWADR